MSTPKPIFTLDQTPPFAKIMTMPRCMFSFIALLTALLLLTTGCERSAPNSSAVSHVQLATNVSALSAALRSRDPETRVAAAQLIAANTSAWTQPSQFVHSTTPTPKCVVTAPWRSAARVATAVQPLFPSKG